MKYSLELLKADKKALQRIYLISIMAALFILMLSIRDFTQSESYITDSSGRITGIEWEDKADRERRLVLSIGEGESASNREVTIRRKQSSGNVNNNVSNENTKEAEREAEISRLITDVEFTNKRKVSLPGKLSDGTVLNWSVKDESGGDYLIIPIIYLVLILLVVKSSLDSRNVDGIIR